MDTLSRRTFLAGTALAAAGGVWPSFAQTVDIAAAKKEGKDPANLPGHSVHGEIFNEGPRQKAFLMGDTANIHFPVTTKHPKVQQFVEQGIGQLHGYWYFEAERSFRQAAMLETDENTGSAVRPSGARSATIPADASLSIVC